MNDSRSTTSGNSRLFRWVVVAFTVLGAGLGLFWWNDPVLGWVGALVGFLVGRAAGEPWRRKGATPNGMRHGHWGLRLGVGAWLLAVIGGAVLVGTGLLRGEGASLLMLFVLPVALVVWVVGGPVASGIARSELAEIEAGTRPESDRAMALWGMALSRAMTLSLLVLLALLAVAVFSR